MAKNKLTVKTDVGTFDRTTARTYTHIVVAEGVRAELLEAERLGTIAYQTKQAEKLEAYQAGTRRDIRPQAVEFDTKFYNENRANGNYGKWAADCRAEVARLVARGPITEDAGKGFGLLGWCGRLDLAQKLASATDTSSYASAGRFRTVRIYAVDGTRVR